MSQIIRKESTTIQPRRGRPRKTTKLINRRIVRKREKNRSWPLQQLENIWRPLLHSGFQRVLESRKVLQMYQKLWKNLENRIKAKFISFVRFLSLVQRFTSLERIFYNRYGRVPSQILFRLLSRKRDTKVIDAEKLAKIRVPVYWCSGLQPKQRSALDQRLKSLDIMLHALGILLSRMSNHFSVYQTDVPVVRFLVDDFLAIIKNCMKGLMKDNLVTSLQAENLWSWPKWSWKLS